MQRITQEKSSVIFLRIEILSQNRNFISKSQFYLKIAILLQIDATFQNFDALFGWQELNVELRQDLFRVGFRFVFSRFVFSRCVSAFQRFEQQDCARLLQSQQLANFSQLFKRLRLLGRRQKRFEDGVDAAFDVDDDLSASVDAENIFQDHVGDEEVAEAIANLKLRIWLCLVLFLQITIQILYQISLIFISLNS